MPIIRILKRKEGKGEYLPTLSEGKYEFGERREKPKGILEFFFKASHRQDTSPTE